MDQNNNKNKVGIFIDSNWFIKDNFNFHPALFNLIKSWIFQDPNHHYFYFSSITERELKKHFKEKVEDPCKKINKCIGKLNKTLKSPYYEEQLESITLLDADVLFNDIIQKFKNDLNITYIDDFSQYINPALNLHFAEKAPFSQKKGNEFKDALVLLALESQNHLIRILSNDGDFKTFCKNKSNLEMLEKSEKLFETLYADLNDEGLLLYLKGLEIDHLIYELIKSKDIDALLGIEDDLISKLELVTYEVETNQLPSDADYTEAHDIQPTIDEINLDLDLNKFSLISVQENNQITISISDIIFDFSIDYEAESEINHDDFSVSLGGQSDSFESSFNILISIELDDLINITQNTDREKLRTQLINSVSDIEIINIDLNEDYFMLTPSLFDDEYD